MVTVFYFRVVVVISFPLMTLSFNDIYGADSLEQFFSNTTVCHGLPAFVYKDEDYWRLENRTLFHTTWVFVGFAHELARAGDVVPITVGGKPVFLIRDKDGTVKAFHNACRHRCLKLIDRPGNAGPRIRCPYHSWVYALDGRLLSTPFFGGPDQHIPEGFDTTAHGLVPVHCEVWHDWIFVNLDPEPEPFAEYVAPLATRLSDIDVANAQPVAILDFGEVHTNWKLLMENFIEPYHVQFVHSTTTEQPLKDHSTVIDGCCLGSAVNISNPVNSGGNTLAVDSLYLTLFPNFVFGRYVPDQIGVHLNIPVAVDRTLQKRAIYITDGGQRDAAEIEALKKLWYDVHKEDHAMVERLQEGKASDVAAGGGMLSPHWETSVRRFQELALEAVSRHSREGGNP